MPKHDKKLFKRVTYDFQSCICPPDEVDALVKDLVSTTHDVFTGQKIEVSDVYLSQSQYDKMPDFRGW